MNPVVKYTFRSAKGGEVTISSRMGEMSAREKAMQHFHGPANNIWCFNRGLGLDLVKKEEKKS